MSHLDETARARLNVALWIGQILLALLFLFAGSMKFVMPVAEMTKQIPLPGAFLHFIGVAEIAGALGLVLPGLLRQYPALTPLAARCLVIIMSGATALTLQTSIVQALFPATIGVVLGLIAYGRERGAPLAHATRVRRSLGELPHYSR